MDIEIIKKIARKKLALRTIHDQTHDIEGKKYDLKVIKIKKNSYNAVATETQDGKHTIDFIYLPEKKGFKITHDTPWAHQFSKNSTVSKELQKICKKIIMKDIESTNK